MLAFIIALSVLAGAIALMSTNYAMYNSSEKEKKRLQAERERVGKIVEAHKRKLENPAFVEKAPPEVVEQSRAQLANMEQQLATLDQNLSTLS